MKLLLSEVLRQNGLAEEADIVCERPFDVFSRVTTEYPGEKCIFLTDKKYLQYLDGSVSMVITSRQIAESLDGSRFGICIADEPRGLFFEIMSLHEKNALNDVSDSVYGKNCSISETAVISPHNVRIGDNVKIGDYVVIHPNTTIGDNVTIQTGVKIGEQDFNLYTFKNKMKQAYHGGHVQIGSDVLINPGVVIGQAMYSYGITYVGNCCAIGANTAIGHNVVIHDDCEICGNSILGGYCKVGAHSRLFMSVTVANAITLGEHVTVNMGSKVIRDVPDNKTVFGNPAREIIAPAR